MISRNYFFINSLVFDLAETVFTRSLHNGTDLTKVVSCTDQTNNIINNKGILKLLIFFEKKVATRPFLQKYSFQKVADFFFRNDTYFVPIKKK